MLLLECKKCHLVKEENEFRKNVKTSTGREGACKMCRNKKTEPKEEKLPNEGKVEIEQSQCGAPGIFTLTTGTGGGGPDILPFTREARGRSLRKVVKFKRPRYQPSCFHCRTVKEEGKETCSCEKRRASSAAYFTRLECARCDGEWDLYNGPGGVIYCDDCLYTVEPPFTELARCSTCTKMRPKNELCAVCERNKGPMPWSWMKGLTGPTGVDPEENRQPITGENINRIIAVEMPNHLKEEEMVPRV